MQVSRDIGEFGSPSPSTSPPMMDSTSNSIINQDINNYTASIDSNSLTENSSLLHKNDEQFAFDNLQNDHSSSIDHPVVQKYATEDAANLTLSSDVLPRAAANISRPTMSAVKIVPTIVPTMLPTTIVVPTIGSSQQASPAPTYELPFKAKTFHGMAESQITFDVVAKLYARGFEEFSTELKVPPQDILELSPTEVVHSALKKGIIQETRSRGSGGSVLKDAVTDAVEVFRPGMTIFYVTEGEIIDIVSHIAKKLRHLPILLQQVFLSNCLSK